MMLHSFQVTLFFILYFFQVALFSCCILFILHSWRFSHLWHSCVLVISNIELHSTNSGPRFCTGSYSNCGVWKISDAENLWQLCWLEIRLIAFRLSTITQKQFIIIMLHFFQFSLFCLALFRRTLHILRSFHFNYCILLSFHIALFLCGTRSCWNFSVLYLFISTQKAH